MSEPLCTRETRLAPSGIGFESVGRPTRSLLPLPRGVMPLAQEEET
jgi:hypothetical protein